MGGLSKKIFQIKNLSEGQIENRLLVDSGNLLFKHTDIAEGSNQERLVARTIVEVYKEIGYDAVAVGPLDLAGGLPFLQQTKNDNFPWISANIFDENEQLLFKQVVTRTIQGHDIIITALSGQSSKPLPGVHIKPWKEVLPDLLQSLRQKNKNCFIILLSTLTDRENQLIAKEFTDIHVLISAYQKVGNAAPRLINNTLITQTAKQGKHQGLFEITFGATREWGENTQKKLVDLQNQLGSVNWQLRRLLKKTNKSNHPEKLEKTINRLNDEKRSIEADISYMEKQAVEETKSGAKQDHFSYRFIGLTKNLPNDQPTDKKIQKLNKDIRTLHTKLKQLKKTSAKASETPASLSLIGHNSCKECHETQMDFWESTRHAKAYRTLLTMGKHLDINCLPCHITTAIQHGKRESLSTETILSYPERLLSVGCETCHGHGKKHATNPEQFKLVLTPTIDTCLSCHTDEHDDNFLYKEKLEKISCPAG